MRSLRPTIGHSGGGRRAIGQWRESGLIESFASKEPAPLWRVPIGPGYNGPVVADGRVYVMDRVTEPEESERIHCFDADTGKPVWSYRYACKYAQCRISGRAAGGDAHRPGPRPIRWGRWGICSASMRPQGMVLWQKDLQKEYKLRIPIWGIAAAPLVEGDKLIVLAGGQDGAAVIALRQGDRQGALAGPRRPDRVFGADRHRPRRQAHAGLLDGHAGGRAGAG